MEPESNEQYWVDLERTIAQDEVSWRDHHISERALDN
jgi:hypothetical protein